MHFLKGYLLRLDQLEAVHDQEFIDSQNLKIQFIQTYKRIQQTYFFLNKLEILQYFMVNILNYLIIMFFMN